jgi:hypothetical protein
MMLSQSNAICLLLSAMLVLGGLWLGTRGSGREGLREGLNKERSKELAEHTKTQREEAVHSAGKYDSDRGAARNHAQVMTELLHTLDADLVTEMLGYAENRHKQGNTYALMNKHAAHATAINTLRTSCETSLKVVQSS